MNDLTNQEFGNWKVMEYAGQDKKLNHIWKCLCLCCGTIRNIRVSRLNEYKVRDNASRCKCPRSIEQFFWDNVIKTNDDDCWIWTGNLFSNGYGRVVRSRRQRGAHIVSWELHYGPVQNGIWVLHKCDNPPCCRPDHLFLGTSVDNNADRHAKGRDAKGEMINNSKLTDRKVIEIRSRYASGGVTYESLAKQISQELGVSIHKSAVGAIVRGHTWRHLLPNYGPTLPARNSYSPNDTPPPVVANLSTARYTD